MFYAFVTPDEDFSKLSLGGLKDNVSALVWVRWRQSGFGRLIVEVAGLEQSGRGCVGVGAEDAGKYWASLAISRKALIPGQEGRIVLLSGLDVKKKNLEFSVSKERQRQTEKDRKKEARNKRMKGETETQR